MKSMVNTKSVTLIKQANIYPHSGCITRTTRNHWFGHKSGVVWLTGLSGAGKSTIASGVEEMLFDQNFMVTVLDGDSLRAGLNSDLDFSVQSREENLRRAGEVASLFTEAGHIVIASFVSPHDNGRQYVKNIVRDNFHLVHVKASLDDCISRDPKGLYQKALSGNIENFTGVGQSYEEPHSPDMVIDTSLNDTASCRNQLLEFITSRFAI